MGIGENIRRNRELKNISQEELALKTRIGTGTLIKYENEERVPDLQKVLLMSTVLDVPASELLETDEQINECQLDQEIIHLVKEMGTKKTKLILRKAKEISEEDFLRVMQMLHDIKYTNKANNRL